MKNINFIKNKLIPFLLISTFMIFSDVMDDDYTSICNAAKIVNPKKIYNKNRSKTKIPNKNKNKQNKEKKKKSIDVLKYDFSEWNKKAGNLIVINKNNEVPKRFNPDLKICKKELGKKQKELGEKKVGAEMYDDLCKMISDAKKDKIELGVCSGYRSIEYQENLFSKQVKREKSRKSKNPEQDASKVVAKPRQSEHNIALAIDINCTNSQFKSQKEYKWLKEHAQDYGFIERYQEGWEDKTGCIYEPWHWRYVGIKNAQEIKQSGKCLEEFIIDKIKKNIVRT